jgi:hypothetical protein
MCGARFWTEICTMMMLRASDATIVGLKRLTPAYVRSNSMPLGCSLPDVVTINDAATLKAPPKERPGQPR